MADLSIIIVNWNCLDYTRECLKSVAANRGNLDLDVIVVDNASTKGNAELLRAEFPWVRLIKSPENIGFAGANNVGFLESTSINILFLNPDTIVLGDALQQMLARLLSTPDAGAVGCKLLNTDGTIQTSCIQRFPTICNQVLDVEALQLRWPHLKFWGIAPLFSDSADPAPVEVISGACLMVRRDVFLAAGQFSREYYMYAEDLDLCYSIRSLGWKCYYVGTAQVIHHGGGASKQRRQSQWSTVMTRKAILRFCRKTRGPSYSRLYQTAMAVSAAARLLLLTSMLLVAKSKSSRDNVEGTIAKWAAIFRWAVGIEDRVAP